MAKNDSERPNNVSCDTLDEFCIEHKEELYNLHVNDAFGSKKHIIFEVIKKVGIKYDTVLKFYKCYIEKSTIDDHYAFLFICNLAVLYDSSGAQLPHNLYIIMMNKFNYYLEVYKTKRFNYEFRCNKCETIIKCLIKLKFDFVPY